MLTRRRKHPGIRRAEGGFTLIELLITMAILGVVVASMYTLYLNMQRTTFNQNEVVDLQQSLRVALDSLNRDIKMAGFLIPGDRTPVAAGSDSDTLVLEAASTLHVFARVAQDIEIPAGTVDTDVKDFIVALPGMADPFEAGDIIRIIRPQNGSQPFDADLEVAGKNRDTPKITVKGFATADAVQYVAGDMIARVVAGAPDPATVTWNLNGTNLERDGQVMATDIAALQFTYLTDDDANVTAVQVTLTADVPNQLDAVARQRSLTSVVRLRN
ncbi:MAG TPA: prepilin-type N-terminal cleavage/methylation domain-containing protein [Desulfuromonadales bacterium]|jgi:prepilin-type N-terminal cleavage/methylation domain-containing protein